MKYSQIIGIIAVIGMIAVCFAPWAHINSLDVMLSGVNGRVNESFTFGTQVKPHGFLGTLMVIFFLTPRIWAKRTNIFIGAINMGLAIKNYIVFSLCRNGDCPEKQYGLYLLVVFAAIALIMTFLPKMKLPNK